MLDVVEERADAGDEPGWARSRGWSDFLLGLADEEVAACERGAFVDTFAKGPPPLAGLARDAALATDLPRAPAPDARPPERLVGARKRAQIDALLAALGPLAAGAARIVDVGAGRGHLTRIAAASLEREAVGLEIDARLVAVARELAREGGARFVQTDARAGAIALERTDLAVGLHACGEVGDRLVVAAAAAGSAVALVSCCLQKISAEERTPLSKAAAGLGIRRGALGLANLSAQDAGVETSLDATLAAREARLALRSLLRARGAPVGGGEEMRGLNRRRARKGFESLAKAALDARGLPPPTRDELAEHASLAKADFGRARRFSLPRSMLARLVEVTLVLDRAAALEEAGREVRVCTLFDANVSPRNIALLAARG